MGLLIGTRRNTDLLGFTFMRYELLNLQEVRLHGTVLEATLVDDSGREQPWNIWIQRNIGSRCLQDPDVQHKKQTSSTRLHVSDLCHGH